MFIKKSKTIVFLICFCFSVFQCETPRNNPLDAGNPNHRLGTISGEVFTQRVPRLAVSDVIVSWKSDDRASRTDQQGKFKINNLKKQNGWLILEKEGYVTDSISVVWNESNTLFEQGFLNAVPQLDSIILYSSIENKRPARKIVTILCNAKITDPDNDIDSVLIKNKTLGLNTFLVFNTTSGWFEKTLKASDLHVNNPDEVIGHEFTISVKDKFGKKFNMATVIVKRVIKEEIITESPSSGEETSAAPTLKWERFDPGFPFRFKAQIYVDETPPTLYWEKDTLNSVLQSLPVDIELEPNDYYWIVWSIDEFENRAASKAKKFYVP